MVDDNLVPAIGAERGLHGGGYGAAGVDVAQDGAIFGIIARARLTGISITPLLEMEEMGLNTDLL